MYSRNATSSSSCAVRKQVRKNEDNHCIDMTESSTNEIDGCSSQCFDIGYIMPTRAEFQCHVESMSIITQSTKDALMQLFDADPLFAVRTHMPHALRPQGWNREVRTRLETHLKESMMIPATTVPTILGLYDKYPRETAQRYLVQSTCSIQ